MYTNSQQQINDFFFVKYRVNCTDSNSKDAKNRQAEYNFGSWNIKWISKIPDKKRGKFRAIAFS